MNMEYRQTEIRRIIKKLSDAGLGSAERAEYFMSYVSRKGRKPYVNFDNIKSIQLDLADEVDVVEMCELTIELKDLYRNNQRNRALIAFDRTDLVDKIIRVCKPKLARDVIQAFGIMWPSYDIIDRYCLKMTMEEVYEFELGSFVVYYLNALVDVTPKRIINYAIFVRNPLIAVECLSKMDYVLTIEEIISLNFYEHDINRSFAKAIIDYGIPLTFEEANSLGMDMHTIVRLFMRDAHLPSTRRALVSYSRFKTMVGMMEFTEPWERFVRAILTIESCGIKRRKSKAARTIQRTWRKLASTPHTPLGRSILLKNYAELVNKN